jgi:ribosomal protein L16 Arg81 hydroxylase
MRRREGFMFISAAASLTPVHFDPEHNFLLQVRGAKEVHAGAFEAEADSQRELERYYRGGHRNLDALPGPDRTFRIVPGEGVYLPTHIPHWVKNGNEPSISFSVTFHTPAILRRGYVHGANARLRRLGITPAPPDRSALRDSAKATLVRGLGAVGRVRNRY